MAELKSFKQVITECKDRKVLYEILDSVLECSTKAAIIEFYNRRMKHSIMFDDNQPQLELELELNNHNHEKPDGHIPMGSGLQGQT